jgi:hypothetical protein
LVGWSQPLQCDWLKKVRFQHKSQCDSCWNRTPVNQSDCRKYHWFQNEYNKLLTLLVIFEKCAKLHSPRRVVQFWHISQSSLVVLIINCTLFRVITYTNFCFCPVSTQRSQTEWTKKKSECFRSRLLLPNWNRPINPLQGVFS